MWKPGGWTEPSHTPRLPQEPQVPLGHGCTNAAGRGADAACSQHELGGSTAEDIKRNETERNKNKEILIK